MLCAIPNQHTKRHPVTQSLPVKITHMMVELHQRGYTSLYLYCGMSPSGMDWRYKIGLTAEGQWPAHPSIIRGSMRATGTLKWASDTSSPQSLADGFEATFKETLAGTKAAPTAYSIWFDALVASLEENELLVFYADYPAKHKPLLKEAPGYTRWW